MSLLAETRARILMMGLIGGLILSLSLARWLDKRGVIEIHAAMPEQGGWSPDQLKAQVGQPLKLRLVSDDVLHGFAIGQGDRPALELKPGLPVETTLVFTQPGKYVYYCTHWCGPNHWRMRGVIDVLGHGPQKQALPDPLYLELGLNIDLSHPAAVIPERMPSARSGAAFEDLIPAVYRSQIYFQTHSPAEAWRALKSESILTEMDDQQVWDLVAFIWQSNTTPAGLAQGERLYAANCAACHGETGAGDGVFAASLAAPTVELEPASTDSMRGQQPVTPADFTDPEQMLGASPALLEGKIERGGMGTGMPYWGPIFTREQIWDIVGYLWKFQFDWR
jgi:mono/diheme cytochrome c family protein/plastocyanin